jgi:tRNA (guanine-N7-)-methyltransferase
VFGFDGPLELEIGCGAGGFALEYCRRNPGVRFVAFEWRKKFAREAQHRADKHGLINLRVIEGDARLAVPRLFAENSLDAIHLQFPDPWWKRAHQKRAILQPEFTALLCTRLKPGGRFDFRTDVMERAQAGLRVLEAAGFKNPLGPGAFHPFDPDEVPSTRERRYLASGQPVYRARLTKD